MKEQLQKRLAKGEVKQVIDQLTAITQQPEHAQLREEVLMQSARYQSYAKSKRLGITSYEEQSRTLAQINQALYHIIEELSDENTEPHQKPQSMNASKKPKGFLKPIITIVGLLAGITAILTYCGINPFQNASKAGDSVTVLAHGPAGKDDLVLPNRGKVYLIYGDAKIPEQINNEGEATFKQVPEKFFQSGARVEILFEDPEGEPYRAANPDSLYQLKREKHIALQVVLQGMDKIEGIVEHFETGDPIEGATAHIFGLKTESNAYGEFTLKIPEDRQEQFITLRVFKEGYRSWEMDNIPTTTERRLTIPLKPKK